MNKEKVAMDVEESDATVAARGDSTVPAFFAGKDVFITGASGFLGRVLIERLLRNSPDIGTLFLLVRPKRGHGAQERIAQFTNVSLFERLRREQPGALAKLRGVEGDAAVPGLGLSAGDRQLLEERVAMVFHAAASVRFDDPLKKAVLLNVRGTRDLCELALRMPRLQAFVHVSTAYTNSDRSVIEEKLYPPPGDWKTYIKAAETMDSRPLDILTFRLLGKHANTYVFTKAMAEHVVNGYNDKLPIGIIRPSVVNGTEEEPFPGWVDNLNGPTSLALSATLGITHVFVHDETKYLDVIPVDYVVAGIVLEAVQLGMKTKSDVLTICNATCDKYIANFSQITSKIYNVCSEFRIQRAYHIYFCFVQTIFLYKILFCLLDLPISIIIDILAKCTKQKQRFLKIHRRIIVATIKTSYFSLNTFQFTKRNSFALTDILSSEESKKYKLSTAQVSTEQYLFAINAEVKKYFFPKDNTNPGKQDTVFLIIHYMVCGILLFVLWKSNVIFYFTWVSLNISRFLLAI